MRKLMLLFSALVLCVGAAFGQGKTVSGTVISAEDNLPVIGAAVQVKGDATIGTVTDFDGNFTITLPDGATTLVISSMGLQTQEVAAKDGMKVVLTADAKVLDEVMVVAYSTATTKTYVGSAKVVKGETLEKKNPSEVSKALAGEVAGVQVVSTSGQPGSSATIVIRGPGSVNSSTAPLYVVDGIPYDGDVSSIDPSDIASTTILKDATATSLYGSRGSNGVILITTRKGTSGESGKIDVDVKYGVNMRLLPLHESVQDPATFMELAWQGLYNNAVLSGDKDPYATANKNVFSNACIPTIYNLWQVTGTSGFGDQLFVDGKFDRANAKLKQGYIDQPMTSWQDAIFRTGQKVDATVKIHGGSDKTTYFTSIGYLKDEGYYIGSDFNRFTARTNIDHQAKKWLKGNMNLAYTYSTVNNAGQESGGAGQTVNNGFYFLNGIAPIFPVYMRDADGYILDENGNKWDKNSGVNKAYDYGMYEGYARLFGSGINPAGALRLDRQYTQQHQFTGSAMLKVTFIKGLDLTANVGLQYINANLSQLKNALYGDAQGVGRSIKQVADNLSFTANQILSYANTFANDHNFDAFIGHETTLYNTGVFISGKNYTARPDGYELDNLTEMSFISSDRNQFTMESYFGQVRYDYKNKYFFHGTFRADGSSRFAKGHRWGYFGSVGLSWMLSNEDFMQGVNLLKNMKLRASWGSLGNQNISLYLTQDGYALSDFENLPALSWSYKGTEDLTWESSNIWNIGVDFDLGKYFSFSADYFYRTTTNMLFSRAAAPSLGYGSYYVNDGILGNQGVETQMNINAVDTRNVKLNIRLNGAYYYTEMLKMPLDPSTGEDMIMSGALMVGHSPYDHLMVHYEGVDHETGIAQYRQVFKINEDGTEEPILNLPLEREKAAREGKELKTREALTAQPSEATIDFVGKRATPDFSGGFGFDLTLYGFDLSATFMYGIGGYGLDVTYLTMMNSDRAGKQNWHVDMLNAWTPDNKDSNIPKLSNGVDRYANASSDRFLTSNSYLALSNVRLGYSFPKKWTEKILLNNLNLWVSGDNLFCLSARKGYFPFASFTGSTDIAQYVPLSTIMCGIKLQF